MKRQRIQWLLWALIAALLLMAAAPVALADAGNFAGDSDFGGSDSSWDSGWSSSDDDWGSSWSSSSSGSYSGSGFSDDGDNVSILVVVIVVIIILYVVRKNNRGGKGGNRPTGGSGGRTIPTQVNNQAETQRNLQQLMESDPGFSKEAFLERVSNLYVQLQDAWEAKKWEPIRLMMTDALYNQFKRQLDEYIRNKQTNYVDRIAVLSAEITGCRQDAVNDIIEVTLKTRIVDYVLSDEDGSLISGDKRKEKFMTYAWTLIRAKGVTTQQDEGVHQVNCPGCGAPMSVNQSGQCEYCGSTLTSGQYNWVVSAIRGLSQVTK